MARAPKRRSRASAPVAALLACGLATVAAPAQNRDHPGLVHIGLGNWATPAEAQAKGLVCYRGRWLPQSMQKRLEAWEREDRKTSSWKDALRTSSKHYRIQTNLPRFIVELELEPFLDELYRTYVQVFRDEFGVTGKAADKNFIKVYDGYEDYARNEADELGPPPRENPGFFRGGDELVMFYDETDEADFYGTVFHEGAHQFVNAALPGADFPVWIDEGLAVYFEGCTWSRATKRITIGGVPPERLEAAQELLRAAAARGPVSAQTLFMGVPKSAFDADQYALAWSFLYYLMHRDGGAKKPAFAKFLREMNRAGVKPVAEVFRKATGEDLAQVEKGWPEFVLQQPLPPLPHWVTVALNPADPSIDVQQDDELWSFDGVEVYGLEQLRQLWDARAKDRDVEVIVVRRVPAPPPAKYRRTFVRTKIPRGSTVELVGTGVVTRCSQLRD